MRFARQLLLLAGLAWLGLPLLHAQREKLPPDDLAYVQQHYPNARKTSTSIRYIIEKKGHGQDARPGDLVKVLYVGRLLRGKVFDEVLDPQHPFTFHVRRSEVIEGWYQILQSMNKGEKCLVIIPSELGYGYRGQPPSIPGDATLVFDIEVLDIVRER